MSDKVELKGCPFCGWGLISVQTAADIEEINSLELPDGVPSVYETSYAAICSFSIGGCGATGAYRDTINGAAKVWNNREQEVAALQTALQKAETERDEWKAQLDLGWQKSVEKSIAQVWEQKERAEESERKLELLQPQWSDDAPTEPGWYWWRLIKGDRPVMVEIQKMQVTDNLSMWIPEDSEVLFGDELEGQWSGPITPPQTGDER